jgi:hypothetical protein
MENDNQVNEPVSGYGQPSDFQQVWRLFQETDKKFKETDRILTEMFQETDRQFKETDRQFKETDRQFKETDRQFKETDRQLQETDKKINKLSDLFTSQWGKLVESLVEGDLVKLLNARGILVESVIQRRKGSKEGVNFEYDLIAVNTEEMVIVEVKTTLRPQDVDDFHKKLWKAKTFMPEYKHMRIYGAVAFITVHGSSDSMAEKLGFFAIRATGSSSSIINGENFKPKAF